MARRAIYRPRRPRETALYQRLEHDAALQPLPISLRPLRAPIPAQRPTHPLRTNPKPGPHALPSCPPYPDPQPRTDCRVDSPFPLLWTHSREKQIPICPTGSQIQFAAPLGVHLAPSCPVSDHGHRVDWSREYDGGSDPRLLWSSSGSVRRSMPCSIRAAACPIGSQARRSYGGDRVSLFPSLFGPWSRYFLLQRHVAPPDSRMRAHAYCLGGESPSEARTSASTANAVTSEVTNRRGETARSISSSKGLKSDAGRSG